MSDYDRALNEIRDIRRQVARSTEFRGYGPLTLCATAGLAIVAGLGQASFVPHPEATPWVYMGVWGATAIISLALIATQTRTRARGGCTRRWQTR